MTIKGLLEQVEVQAMAAANVYREKWLTYRHLQEAHIERCELALICLHQASVQTKSLRTARKISKLEKFYQDYVRRDRSSIQYSIEQRAIRREDREEWEALGYRVFDVIDSGTFSTQPFPLEYAHLGARREIDSLAKLGYSAHTQCPDYRHWTGYDWYQRSFPCASGHVVVLIRVDTPAELHQARLAYAAEQDAYWVEMGKKYNWTTPMRPTSFRNWD